ncbi:hypothetical protein B0H10DRAFT_2243088 [Mycena sp. CBHHK59/15]|nr:hypothetical protein B0H10DRAFT_2243088 [Mycena sp. CBHHK59/15]
MARDMFGKKKRCSSAHTGTVMHIGCSTVTTTGKENVAPDSEDLLEKVRNLEGKVDTFGTQLDLQAQKTRDARVKLQNTRRREERARISNMELKDRLNNTEAVVDELLMAQLSLTDTESQIAVLTAQNSVLAKKAKALAMQIRRAPNQRVKAVERVKVAAHIFKLQENSVISAASRELVTDLVALHNVPVSRVLDVIKSMAQAVGVSVDGDISERSVGRIMLEGGIISQVQIIDEVQHAGDITISGNGTSLYNIQQESKFMNYKTTLYGRSKHVNWFLGIATAVNHTAETQVDSWKEINEEMHEIYNTTVGLENPVDADTLPARITRMNSDHAADQKKVAHGIGGVDRWKQQSDRKLWGEKELRSWSSEDLLPLIFAAAAKKIEAAGGMDTFNALSLAEQDILNKTMFIDICVQVGTDIFNVMSPKEQHKTDLFIWAGCCMHKELNAVKGGNAVMMASYIGH